MGHGEVGRRVIGRVKEVRAEMDLEIVGRVIAGRAEMVRGGRECESSGMLAGGLCLPASGTVRESRSGLTCLGSWSFNRLLDI